MSTLSSINISFTVYDKNVAIADIGDHHHIDQSIIVSHMVGAPEASHDSELYPAFYPAKSTIHCRSIIMIL